MPRPPRIAPGGVVYHVLNRGVGRMTLFEHDQDFLAFLRCLHDAQAATPISLFSYCIMPNHWHLLVRPAENGHLAAFMQRLTVMHANRWQQHRRRDGAGHVYQGRYKSFPVQSDRHFLTVARYVERNALRANLVRKAENWQWGSLWQRTNARPHQEDTMPTLSPWPVGCPAHWVDLVNTPLNDDELDAVRQSISRGQPFGGDRWAKRTAELHGLGSTLRTRGRPKKGAGTFS